MSSYLGLVSFLVALAFTEGVLKPAVVWLVHRQIRRYVPAVLDRLDPILPTWIARYSEEELRELVFDEIFSVGLEHNETISDALAEHILKEVIHQYSFLTNAGKNNGTTAAG